MLCPPPGTLPDPGISYAFCTGRQVLYHSGHLGSPCELYLILKRASKEAIGEGNGNPLQCSCLENPVDRGAWWAALHRVTQSRTQLKQLSMHSCIGEGNGNPLQYSCLENPRDRGAWWAAVYGAAQSPTRLKQKQQQGSNSNAPIAPTIPIVPIGTINS